MTELRGLIERMGEINLTAIEESADLQKRYDFLTTQKADLESALSQLEAPIEKINRASRKRFKEVFDAINDKFQEVFPRLFGGGRARLLPLGRAAFGRRRPRLAGGRARPPARTSSDSRRCSHPTPDPASNATMPRRDGMSGATVSRPRGPSADGGPRRRRSRSPLPATAPQAATRRCAALRGRPPAAPSAAPAARRTKPAPPGRVNVRACRRSRGRQQRVHRHRHSPRVQRAEKGDRPVAVVVHQHHHPLFTPDADRTQACRGAADGVVQLAVMQHAGVVDERRLRSACLVQAEQVLGEVETAFGRGDGGWGHQLECFRPCRTEEHALLCLLGT